MRYEFKAECFKVLAHPLRIRILDSLRNGPLTVRDIQAALDVEQSTLSQQLSVLRLRNFVHTERKGTSIYYQVSDPAIWPLLDAAFEIFTKQLVNVQSVLQGLENTTSPIDVLIESLLPEHDARDF